ncbi:hypothetical protein GCM10027056_19630 [Glaciibacter psychrotolerans]
MLAVFRLLLIAGLPLERFAWGCQDEVLPHLRLGNAVSIVLYEVFALVVLERAQLTALLTGANSSPWPCGCSPATSRAA